MAVSPNFNHVLPQIFERPLSYEPDRFAPPRDEDKKKPFSYMGFGGGRHACIGQNFAYLQVCWLACGREYFVSARVAKRLQFWAGLKVECCVCPGLSMFGRQCVPGCCKPLRQCVALATLA